MRRGGTKSTPLPDFYIGAHAAVAGFRLLTRGDPSALPHRQTLRAMIDWSFGLLTGPERALLRRLAVFAGGFTLEAAEAVGAGRDLPAIDVLDVLTELVEKSLVVVDAVFSMDGDIAPLRALAQAAIYLATAPKSNSATLALGEDFR